MRLSRDCMVYCGIAILLCFTQGATSNDTQLYSKPQQSVDYDEAAGQDPVPGASRMGHWAHWGNTTEEATQMNQGVAPLISVQRMRFATHTSPLSEPARLPSMHDELMSEMLLKSLDFLESSNQENDDSLPPTSIEHQRHIILLPQHDAMATYNEHPVSPIPNGILIRMRFRSMGVGDENELPAQQVSPEPIEDASANQPEAVDPYVPSYSNSEDETSNEPHVPFTPHRSQWSALRKRSLFLCGFCIACIILSLLCTVALLQTILSRIASVRRVAAESSMIPPASLNEVVTPKTKVK